MKDYNVSASYNEDDTFKQYEIVRPNTKVSDFSYPLSMFKNGDVPLPPMESGKIYFCFRSKLNMIVNISGLGVATLSDQNCFPSAETPALWEN